MWLLFLIMDVWLTGTVFVPFLLLVLWVATKWKRLGWLNTSRRRWVRIWAGVGGVKFIFIVGLLWMLRGGNGGFNGGGWTDYAIEMAFWKFPMADSFYYIRAFLITLVVACAVMVEDGCLAALASWVFERMEDGLKGRRGTATVERYFFSLLGSVWVMGVANLVDFRRLHYCDDCPLLYGVPFKFLHAGGFAWIAEFIWRGVIGNMLLVVGVGLIAGFAWNVVLRGRVATQTGVQ
jgi:hypothetical protein